MNGATPVSRLEGTVEDRQVFILDVRRAFDGFVLVDVFYDLLDLLDVVSQSFERAGYGVVDDFQKTAPHELLVLDERDIRLDSGGVAIHHERDGTGGREHGNLRVFHSIFFGFTASLIPGFSGRRQKIERDMRRRDFVGVGAMFV